MKFTEEQLKQYVSPLSDTENQMCLNAIKMVRDALKDLGFTDDNKAISPLYPETYSYFLEMRSIYGSRKIKLFIQGSYANNTNVRTQSDVDIAVVQEEVFQTQYRNSSEYPQSDASYGFITAPIPDKSFKDEVQECLENKFGNDVERKNKSIKVYGNTYRKDADTVPCRRYKDYRIDYINNPDNYIGGIFIKADDGEVIINYPEQHIANGKKKNNDTNYYYKKMVRILKMMRYLMSNNGCYSANNVSSFGLESLLWNLPNDIFMKYTIYRYEFGEIVNYLYNTSYLLSRYKEANGIKILCPYSVDIEKYKVFITDLKTFYNYDI
ncbi:MAG: hypothetical protein K0R54_2568 [Clostridiaceae bacterium]|nr:hypothetical protein [Clostridiaceae bacterium]